MSSAISKLNVWRENESRKLRTAQRSTKESGKELCNAVKRNGRNDNYLKFKQGRERERKREGREVFELIRKSKKKCGVREKWVERE